MADYTKNMKQGGGPVLNAVNAANTTPTTDADIMVDVGMYTHIDLILQESGGGTFDAKVWWYYADADVWVEDIAVGTLTVAANSSAGAFLTSSAATSLYVEVLNFAGGADASAWFYGRGTIGR